MKTKYMSAVILLLVLITTACGSNPAPTSTSTSNTETKGNSDTVKIAYFAAGSTNSYLSASFKAAEDTAKKLGMELEIFDGRFDPLTQLNQIQNGMTSGKFKGFVVTPLDGNLLCKILSKDAPSKGIAVSVINAPLCGSSDWKEGTITYVGGQEVDVYKNIINNFLKDKPEGGTFAVIGGPATGGPYLSMKTAFESELPKYPKWKMVGMHATTYQANEAFQVAQNILQSNPKLDFIFSNYSGMTVGVVKAIKAAKRTDVKVYDFGGDKWSFEAVKSGDIQSTVMMLPREEVQRAIEALHDHLNGKVVPKYIDLTKDPILPGTAFVDQSNMAQFNEKGLPEY